jgi:hypothetical protein
MEKLSVWEHLIQSQDPKFPYRMSMTIAYRWIEEEVVASSPVEGFNNDANETENTKEQSKETENNNTHHGEKEDEKTANYKKKYNRVLQVLGGVDQEYYPKSNCGLMPYIVVSKEARGMGLSTILVQKGFVALNAIAVKYTEGRANGINELFIELSQKSDSKADGNPYHSLAAAETRHKIWGRVGFVGLDFTFYHPGYLRNSAHQLTIYRPKDGTKTEEEVNKPVPAEIIDLFIRDLFRGILMQEDQEHQTDEEADKALHPELKDRQLVTIGVWR